MDSCLKLDFSNRIETCFCGSTFKNKINSKSCKSKEEFYFKRILCTIQDRNFCCFRNLLIPKGAKSTFYLVNVIKYYKGTDRGLRFNIYSTGF